MPNILIGCEESGALRRAFQAQGFTNVYSNDIEPASDGEVDYHIEGDVFAAIAQGPTCTSLPDQKWDLIILHPPCDAMALCGNRWYAKGKPGYHERVAAWQWTVKLWNAACEACKHVAMENPASTLFRHLKPNPVQYIQPWQFGDKEFKKTGFCLRGLPELTYTDVLDPPVTPEERKKWEKVWRMPPGPEHKRLRSVTYPGIAAAIADQWGALL